MSNFQRLVAPCLAAAALVGGALASSSTAQAAPSVSGSSTTAASAMAMKRYYLGRYYDIRACINAIDSVTRPNGIYDDAECIDAGDYYQLWGIIY